MSILLKTALLLALSNVFMTFAWYGHLGELRQKPLLIAVLASWGIAFFEYLVQVPANRVGFEGGFKLSQLKILQEVISLSVFVPIMIFFFREAWRWDYLWAAICVLGAVFFIFRERDVGPPPTSVEQVARMSVTGATPEPPGQP